MSRVAVTAFGALVSGASFWVVLGSLAAFYFSRLPGGSREGGGAMAGFFFVGPACGFIGMLLGGWLTWRLLADPQRTGPVAMGFAGIAAILVIGTVIALQPTVVKPDDYPGKKAAFEVEVSFPVADIDGLGKADRIDLELRAGDGTDTTPWKRDRIRREGGRAIVPGAFPIRAHPRTKLLAVMKNDQQVMCSTLNVEGNLESTTDWSRWQTMDDGLLARWRLVVE